MQVWRHIHLRSRTMGHLVGKDRNALNVSNSPIILYVSLMLYIFGFYNILLNNYSDDVYNFIISFYGLCS